MRIALVASALLMIAPASALHAKIYDLDYKGTITGGTSQGDLGPKGTSLAGIDIDLLFALDYPGAQELINPDGSLNYYGGPNYGEASPVTATLDVEGKHFNFDGSYYSTHYQQAGNPIYGDNIYDQVADADGTYAIAQVVAPTGSLIGTLEDPTSLHSKTTTSPDSLGFFILPDNTTAPFSISSFTFSIPGMRGALPEPSAWIMMIMGFGFIGWVLRRDDAAAVWAGNGSRGGAAEPMPRMWSPRSPHLSYP